MTWYQTVILWLFNLAENLRHFQTWRKEVRAKSLMTPHELRRAMGWKAAAWTIRFPPKPTAHVLTFQANRRTA